MSDIFDWICQRPRLLAGQPLPMRGFPFKME
jgi:hypothetical protein